MSHNRLEIIGQGLFSNLYNLKTLDLSHNCLRFIEEFSFKSVNLLENIFLDANSQLNFFPNTFYGLDSIKAISIGFKIIQKSLNKKSLLDTLKPVNLKNVGELSYFRSISLTYTDEEKVDCELVLEFIKHMIQVNLRSDYDFVLFNRFCYDIFLS